MTDLRTRPSVDSGELTAAAHRRRLPAQAWIVLGLLLVVGVGYAVGFSPLLGARTVDVDGEHRVSASTIRTAAAVRSGTPLARLDTAAVAARVRQLPEVADVAVSVSYPSTVVIRVSERQAVGVTALGPHLFGLVDGTGRQFRTAAVRPAGLPLLDPVAGAAQPRATLRALAQVGHSLPRALQTEVGRISASGPDAVTLTMTNGVTVFWGGAGRSADKAQVLPILLKRGGSTFDVSNPDLVYAH